MVNAQDWQAVVVALESDGWRTWKRRNVLVVRGRSWERVLISADAQGKLHAHPSRVTICLVPVVSFLAIFLSRSTQQLDYFSAVDVMFIQGIMAFSVAAAAVDFVLAAVASAEVARLVRSVSRPRS